MFICWLIVELCLLRRSLDLPNAIFPWNSTVQVASYVQAQTNQYPSCQPNSTLSSMLPEPKTSQHWRILFFCRLLQYPQKDFLKSVEDICWNILSCRQVRSWEYRVVILEWCAKSKSNYVIYIYTYIILVRWYWVQFWPVPKPSATSCSQNQLEENVGSPGAEASCHSLGFSFSILYWIHPA